MRSGYAQILSWHKRHGVARLREKFRGELDERERHKRYFALLDELPSPESADLQSISLIAREVLSGSFEWAYSEKTNEGTPLHVLARGILDAAIELKSRRSPEGLQEEIANFRNVVGTAGSLPPLQIVIPVHAERGWNAEDYYKYAATVYHDLPHAENNVGGIVVLIETNMGTAGRSEEKYRFLNSTALRFHEVKEPTALVNLALVGKIIIEKIKME